MNSVATYTNVKVHVLQKAFLGSLFIALCSHISIPTTPVPVTLQTFAILCIALTNTPIATASAILLYLFEATLGLPVLAGGPCPLWMLDPTAGYLIGFPIAGYLISTLVSKTDSFLLKLSALLLGQLVIHLLGFVVLSSYIGTYAALVSGALYFIPLDIIKGVIALLLTSKIIQRK